ncbi:hypothetical protein SAY87_018235 [Trapa incisa]|uniref:Uncharacterized protein n=1 Tax=Trapa incisa TaxID=236973 RepID=A0AAN7KX76_9MYRT|nr:hypothetical protein SAY87_018235 [Trapa incisa]
MREAFTISMKSALALLVVAFLSVFLYTTFSSTNLLLSCPHCDVLPHRITWPANETDAPTNISHVMFGIGGSVKTWDTCRHYCEIWWQPKITLGFIWLEESPSNNVSWPVSSPPYRVSTNISQTRNSSCWYCSRPSIRIARVIKESFDLGLTNIRWFVMGDDDTVFFTENLLTVLSKYDHKQKYYIGATSESLDQNVMHSYRMAYGGGGFAISYPLAAELVKILDGCISRYAPMYGSDQMVQGCISEIGVPLTTELGFHQLDIRKSPYGLLAAHPLAPLLSLHHLDYVDPLFPSTTQQSSLNRLRTAYNLDPGRALQHTFCHDLTRNWSISISWGYTIQLYPSLMTANDLEVAPLTFQTWRARSDGPFTFETRPVDLNPCQQPVVYFLDGATKAGPSQTLTTYGRHVEEGEKCNLRGYIVAREVKRFKVSASKLDPKTWTKAPSRECCEVINARRGTGKVVEVKIRSCNPWESVSPPP